MDAVTQATETWKASDGSMWYKKYSDGWIEQGGISTTNATLNFPLAFSDTNYTIVGTFMDMGNGSAISFQARTKSTTLIKASWTCDREHGYADGAFKLNWYACGY
jgi:hypothetical protein